MPETKAYISISGGMESRCKTPYSLCELQAALEAMLELMSLEKNGAAGEYTLELALLTDEDISELNRQYLDLAGPTNILAFPSSEGHSSVKARPETLGWIALSADALRREAIIYRQDVSEYSLNLLAHGLAHLLGYEHGEDMDALSQKAVFAAKARLTEV
jgi:probable rRNA maturation factor